MKKVLLISGSWPPARCGVGLYTHMYYEHVSKNSNLNFSLLTSEEFAPKVPQSFTTPQWRLRDLPAMLRGVKHAEPDIIHMQYPTLPYKRQLGINLLPWLLKLRGHTIVMTMHEYFQTSRLGKIRSCITALPARQVIVSNQADAISLPAFIRKKVRIVPISATIPTLPPQPERARAILETAGLDPTKQTAVFFGMPFPSKRLDILIEAAGAFSDKLQLLLIFDDSSPDAYVQEVVQKARAAKDQGAPIGLAGFLNDADVSLSLHEATYFLLPQSRPPLTAKSGTSIAACLHGCIVVAAQTTPEQLSAPFISEDNCLLLQDMSPANLAAQLNELAEQPPRQKQLIENALKLTDYFNWDEIADAYAKLYEEVN